MRNFFDRRNPAQAPVAVQQSLTELLLKTLKGMASLDRLQNAVGGEGVLDAFKQELSDLKAAMSVAQHVAQPYHSAGGDGSQLACAAVDIAVEGMDTDEPQAPPPADTESLFTAHVSALLAALRAADTDATREQLVIDSHWRLFTDGYGPGRPRLSGLPPAPCSLNAQDEVIGSQWIVQDHTAGSST